MNYNEDTDTTAISVKEPFKLTIPHLNDMQAKKNPFCKSSSLETSLISKISIMTTVHKNFHEYEGEDQVIVIKIPCLPRPDSVRIPIPEDNESEVEEPISDDELKDADELSTTKEVITGRTSVSLSYEIIVHFNTMRNMPLTLKEEVYARTVELCNQPKGSSGKTLILDMDDTLIHTLISSLNYSKIRLDHKNAKIIMYKDEDKLTLYSAKVIIRPYALELLKELSKIYEIVIFTAAEKCYASAILDLLDPNKKYISYRIYRENCIIKKRAVSKDLRIFKNRDLNNIVIVDNTISCFADHLSNGIHVPTYYGQENDDSLEKVLNLLKEIANCSSIPKALDERVGLKRLYNHFIKSNYSQ